MGVVCLYSPIEENTHWMCTYNVHLVAKCCFSGMIIQYSTGQNKLYVIYYSVTVPWCDCYHVVVCMQRNVNVQFNKTLSQ